MKLIRKIYRNIPLLFKPRKLIRKIKQKISYLFLPNKPVICDGPGFKILVRPPRKNVIGRSLYCTGIWEEDVTNFVQSKVEKGWHIVDVGAEKGYYSLLFALKCGEKGAVAAFEPDPEALPYLTENISMFKYKNISQYNFALTDHSGHGMMKQEGKGQLYPDKESHDEKSNTVEMVTFDDFWPNLSWKKFDLVKIDVEGAEILVLKGMNETIKKYHPHILIEIHPRQLKEAFNSSAEEVMKILTEKYSYKLTPVDRDTLDIPKDGNITLWAIG